MRAKNCGSLLASLASFLVYHAELSCPCFAYNSNRYLFLIIHAAVLEPLLVFLSYTGHATLSIDFLKLIVEQWENAGMLN
jgi:hypothetical protein